MTLKNHREISKKWLKGLIRTRNGKWPLRDEETPLKYNAYMHKVNFIPVLYFGHPAL